MKKQPVVAIDHGRVIDSFGELSKSTHYHSYKTQCGRCGCAFVFSAKAQQYVFETRRVPVSKKDSATFCEDCAARAGDANRTQRESKVARKKAMDVHVDPSDGASMLKVIEARLQRAEFQTPKSLERLLEYARRSRNLGGHNSQRATYWEARILECMGRTDEALLAYSRFVSDPGVGNAKLLNDAKKKI